MVTSGAEAEDVLARGYTCLAYHGDLWLYQQALQTGIATIREAAHR